MARNVKVNVPNRSSHDLSTRRLGTGKVGTLIPVLCTELMAGTKFSLSAACNAQLAPLATDAFMNLKLKFEAFAVPHRVIHGGYTKWLTGEPIQVLSGQSLVTRYSAMPFCSFGFGDTAAEKTNQIKIFGPQSLCDYLGMRFSVDDVTKFGNDGDTITFTPLPFVAYHRIWNDWYRNTRVQKSAFMDQYNNLATGYYFASNFDNAIEDYSVSPYQVVNKNINPAAQFDSNGYPLLARLADGVNLFALRQRNFGYDYFTNATLAAQLGSAQSVSTSGNSFTISSLRAANSLQQWLERSNLSGYRWQDYLHAHYGTSLSSGIANRSIYLGRYEMDVVSKGVEQTANWDSPDNINSNPFRNYVGARYGNAFVDAGGRIVDTIEFDEPVYLFVMMSLVPRVVYSSGISRYLTHYTKNGSVTDMADPMLQNVGNQDIKANEVMASIASTTIFGYTDRYAEYMTQPDTLHGLLRDGSTLSPFALQRNIGGTVAPPTISSAFLEIPIDYLKSVKIDQDSGTLDAFDYWFDVAFNFPVSHPLYEYSIPSLQDPAAEHGHEVNVDTFNHL